MKQTAVEWLVEQFDNIVELYPSEWEKINNAIDQAKQMEKQQIGDAFYEGMDYYMEYGKDASKYYNKTYGKE